VIDPREIELVNSPHVKADYHLQLKPGTNVAMITALAHVIVTEGWLADAYIDERCDAKSFAQWKEFVARPENSPEATADITGVAPELVRGAARLYAWA
jgi:formate dehydrogenase major subunit